MDGAATKVTSLVRRARGPQLMTISTQTPNHDVFPVFAHFHDDVLYARHRLE